MSQTHINVIGAGLAGSEAAYQIAKRGIPVKLYEMRGVKPTSSAQDGQVCGVGLFQFIPW